MMFGRTIFMLSSLLLIFTSSSIANEKTKMRTQKNWKLNYFKILDHIDYNNVDPNYSTFYKVEMRNNKGNKLAVLLARTMDNLTKMPKSFDFQKYVENQNNEKQYTLKQNGKWEVISLEKVTDIRYANLSPDYSIFYQTELCNAYDNKQLVILCKSKEELKAEAKEHIIEGLENTSKGILEATLATKSGYIGDAAGCSIEAEESAQAFKDAFDEFESAYECYQEIKTIEEEENKKKNED